MDLIITLSSVEVDAINARRGQRPAEDVIHRLLAPLVKADSADRLDHLVNQYKQLTPELQVEATELLQEWFATKQP